VLRGAELILGAEVLGAQHFGAKTVVQTTHGDVNADIVVNCAGLQSDLVARRLGAHPSAQIVPFRGEYFELKPERTHLVKGLIYPVPDPEFSLPRRSPDARRAWACPRWTQRGACLRP